MQFAGMRAAEVARIWGEVFVDDAEERLVRVIATHTDWPGLEEPLLQAPLWQAENGGVAPASYFDAYAVSGYFGFELGSEPKVRNVLNWIKESTDLAAADATAKGWSGPRHREYVSKHRFSLAVAPAAQEIFEGSLNSLLTETYPYQAEVAAKYGLDLIMYEGGTHVVGIGEYSNNETLAEFFNYFNYTPEMAQLYQNLLTGWRGTGGTLFNAFVDVAVPSQYGSWGALRHLDDSNPRWDVLAGFNATTPAWWENRAVGTFDEGVLVRGGPEGETLTGTREEDILLGRNGDDILVGLGGADILHGGAGIDQAVLPGLVEDYRFGAIGDVLLATGPLGTTRLFGIETLSFSGQSSVTHSVIDF